MGDISNQRDHRNATASCFTVKRSATPDIASPDKNFGNI